MPVTACTEALLAVPGGGIIFPFEAVKVEFLRADA
jgi:hypothetical protein